MPRRLKDGIIPAICHYCEETEIPSIFALWSGISTVSAVLGRSCSLDFGYETIYPNLYVVLTAQSATCRKSASIRVAKKLLTEVHPEVNLLSQKMTPEALIDALAGRSSISEDRIILQAEGVAVSGELTTLVDRNAVKSGLTNLMTDLYDCDDFKYRTRGRGVEAIKNPCLSILGGTTLPWIKEALSVSAITGGFTSRIVFVYLDKRDKDVAWPSLSKENLYRREKIVKDLCKIALMRGPFVPKPSAKQMFEDEYARFNKESELPQNKFLAGYAGRRHITLLKVAMAMSASRSDEREVDDGDMIVAIQALESIEDHLPRVMRAITATETGDICQQLFDVIKQKKVIVRSELMKAMRHKITASQLDDLMTGLVQEGAVLQDSRDGKMIYLFNENG